MDHSTVIILLECICIAFGAGLVFGVFGSGSGLIMMPGFYYVLRHFSLASSHTMQVAVATTAAASAILGLFSSYEQYKRGNVDFPAVKKMFPGLFLGTLMAAASLGFVPSAWLKDVFGVVVLMVSVWLITYRSELDNKRWSLQGLFHFIRTFVIALLWFLLGVAVFIVPYLHKCGLDIRRSVGCASFLASLFSATAAIMFMISGVWTLGFSHWQWGYVNGGIFLISLIPSSLASRWGSQVSVRINPNQLKKIYAILVFVVGLLMIV